MLAANRKLFALVLSLLLDVSIAAVSRDAQAAPRDQRNARLYFIRESGPYGP